ncbi:MAG: type II toxin-antitoxin system VapC family toxin [Planctomycetia bacterium]|nr:type II toxin-antitoxin system VapC family toxin [Planctomycetia bacterium]
MNEVFADTCFWVALVDPKDPLREAALKAARQLGGRIIVTSREVLLEFLNYFCEYGEHLRALSLKQLDSILANTNVMVMPYTLSHYEKGLKLFRERKDKKYSLTDCISFTHMTDRGIQDALTADHHFEQEGFRILLQAPPAK